MASKFDTLPFYQKMASNIDGMVLEGSVLINMLNPAKLGLLDNIQLSEK